MATTGGYGWRPRDCRQRSPAVGPTNFAFMTLQAAIDGLGVAIGRTTFVQDDIAKGRLVAPFDMTLPAEAATISSRRRTRSPRPKSKPSAPG